MLLRHIRYLKAVAEHGSFTRAAEALHVSQPALSQQIKELEERLGAQLLDRSGRQIHPTDLGSVYLRHVRRALEELEEGRRAVRDVEDLSTGSLRLGTTLSATAYMIGPLLHRFRARYPGIALTVRVAPQEEIEPALRDDQLDLAIGFGDIHAEDIEATHLHDERLALIVGSDQVAARSSVMTASELAATPLALLDASFSTRRVIDQYFRGKGLRPTIAMEANSIAVLLEAVLQAGLATIQPEHVAGAGLVAVKLNPAFEPRPTALLQRRSAYRSAAARAFAVIAQEVAMSLKGQ
ncbi:MAG: transcriptional regulator CynR [Rhizobium sp.]|nr:MAG: transcriptional regulator CynR [Rhizobium sp.]